MTRHAPLAPLAALSLCLSALAFAGPADAASLGLNVHQSQAVGLDVSRDAKVQFVRVDMNWLDVEPTEGAFDFTLFDAIVDGARSRGLEVLAILGYTPAWASSGDTKGGGSMNDVPVAGKYEAFVTATVKHFAGKVSHYEIWNEPNLGQFFEGTTSDYTSRILVPGADAVHVACPTCKVVAPALASVGAGYDTWLDASLTAAAAKIDIASGHAYAAFPEDDAQAGVTKDSFYNKLDQHRKIVVGGVVVYEGPLSYKEVLDKHGFTKPFWLTETGMQAAYGDTTNEAAQAAFYQRALDAMGTRPWWDTTIFYEAFDETGSGYTWGVSLHDDAAPGGYHAKPAMDVLKKGVVMVDAGAPEAGATDSGADAGSGSDAGAPSGSGSGSPPGSPSGSGSGSPSGSGSGSGSGSSSGCSIGAGADGGGIFLMALLAAVRRRRLSSPGGRSRACSRRGSPTTARP